MTYTLKQITHYIEDYNIWNPKFEKGSMVNHKIVEEYSSESKDVIKQILFDLIDPPNYELTDDNIKHNFGIDINSKAIEQIKNYYSYRKLMYSKIMEWLDSGNIHEDYFHFDIPYEYNHYECIECEYENKEKQIEYSFTLKIIN